MVYYLYKITNLINGKVYIGITNNPKIRWEKHCASKYNYALPRAIRKYGKENFEFKVLVIGSKEYIISLETKAIQAFQTLVPLGYNMTTGGDGCSGWKATKQSRLKSQLAALKRFSNRQERTNQSLRMRQAQKLRAKQSCKPVLIYGQIYQSIQEASQILNLNYNTLGWRIRSTTYPDYQFLEANHENI